MKDDTSGLNELPAETWAVETVCNVRVVGGIPASVGEAIDFDSTAVDALLVPVVIVSGAGPVPISVTVELSSSLVDADLDDNGQ